MSMKNSFDHHFGRTGTIGFSEYLFALVKELEWKHVKQRNKRRIRSYWSNRLKTHLKPFSNRIRSTHKIPGYS